MACGPDPGFCRGQKRKARPAKAGGADYFSVRERPQWGQVLPRSRPRCLPQWGQRSTAKWKAVAASPSRITAQPRKKLLDRVNSTAHTSMAMTRPSNRRRAAARGILFMGASPPKNPAARGSRPHRFGW